jgi:tetratricopeptide (TPR) repeat protein
MKGRGIFSYYIGKLYVDKGDLKTALKYFEKSARIEPTFSQSIMAIGVVHEEEKRNDKAAKVYAKYLVKNPNDGLILNRIVQLYFTTEQFAKVIPYAEKLSDLEPDNLNLKVKLGILYTDVKKYDQAIYTFKNLLRSVPKNDKILYYLGAIYQETAEFENSIDYFTLIPPESGLYQDSSVQVAQMLSSLAKNEAPELKNGPNHMRFVKFIDKKIGEGDLVVEFSIVKASYMEAVEDFKESISSLEKVAELESFSDNHKYYLASLYDKVADYKSSEQLIFKILKDDPQNAHAWNFLGYSLIERNEDMDKAFEYITNAVEISPHDGFIRDSLGWYYFKVGKIDKALDELLSAIKAEPTDVSIQKHLAIIYSEKRDFKTAKKHIVEAIRYSKEQTERQELNELFKNIESKRLPASFK